MADIPSWQLKGDWFDVCRCRVPCACTFAQAPDEGQCDGILAWHVREGNFGDVGLDGLNVAALGSFEGNIWAGEAKNAAAGFFLDERADERQREALEALAHGGEGGPWGIFINTYELLSIKPAPFELELAGERSRLKVGDVAELVMEPIKNPVTGTETRGGVMLPTGLVFNAGWCAASTVFRVQDGISYDHSGKQAEYAPFEYSGP